MAGVRALASRHPVLSYYVLTFAISWGGWILVTGGPGGMSGSDWETDPRFPLLVLAMLGGPTTAGLLMTGLVDGRAGFRELLARLLRWRVGIRWYAVALLPAPVLAAAALFALSLSAPIFTAEDRTAVLLMGAMAGLSTIFEEIGWTGFAVPRLRLRHSVLTTGLIVGILWGMWHLLQQLFIGGTYSGGIPLPLYLFLAVFNAVAQLTAYRVLLVWVFDRTDSLLVVTLMHGSLTASTIFIFRPLAEGASFLAFGLMLTSALWLVVASVFASGRRRADLTAAAAAKASTPARTTVSPIESVEASDP
jgi:uncharacterized protein